MKLAAFPLIAAALLLVCPIQRSTFAQVVIHSEHASIEAGAARQTLSTCSAAWADPLPATTVTDHGTAVVHGWTLPPRFAASNQTATFFQVVIQPGFYPAGDEVQLYAFDLRWENGVLAEYGRSVQIYTQRVIPGAWESLAAGETISLGPLGRVISGDDTECSGVTGGLDWSTLQGRCVHLSLGVLTENPAGAQESEQGGFWFDHTGTLTITIDACPSGLAADFNHDRALTVQDIFDFLTAYFAGNPAADANGDGLLGTQDIFDFLAVYFAA